MLWLASGRRGRGREARRAVPLHRGAACPGVAYPRRNPKSTVYVL
jgi:hypothetical protein